jgi:pimeloyl-ACP methyl ester carboxylesterase
LALGLQAPVVVGHSFGGAVAMGYALQFPGEVAGVVALSPIAFPEPRLEHFIFAPRVGLAGRVLNDSLNHTADPLLMPLLWRMTFAPQSVPPEFAAAFPFGTANSLESKHAEGRDAAWLNVGLTLSALNYWSCRTPVRVFGGAQDRVINNLVHGAAMARLLLNGTYTSLSGLGHMIHHFAQPQIVAAVNDLVPR